MTIAVSSEITADRLAINTKMKRLHDQGNQEMTNRPAIAQEDRTLLPPNRMCLDAEIPVVMSALEIAVLATIHTIRTMSTTHLGDHETMVEGNEMGTSPKDTSRTGEAQGMHTTTTTTAGTGEMTATVETALVIAEEMSVTTICSITGIAIVTATMIDATVDMMMTGTTAAEAMERRLESQIRLCGREKR